MLEVERDGIDPAPILRLSGSPGIVFFEGRVARPATGGGVLKFPQCEAADLEVKMGIAGLRTALVSAVRVIGHDSADSLATAHWRPHRNRVGVLQSRIVPRPPIPDRVSKVTILRVNLTASIWKLMLDDDNPPRIHAPVLANNNAIGHRINRSPIGRDPSFDPPEIDAGVFSR
jgi:hypothetical protein